MVKNNQGYTMLGVIMMILLIALTSVVFITELTFTVGEEQGKIDEKIAPIVYKNYVLRYLYHRKGLLEPTAGWVETLDGQALRYRITEQQDYFYFDVMLYSRFSETYRAVIALENNFPKIVRWGKIAEFTQDEAEYD